MYNMGKVSIRAILILRKINDVYFEELMDEYFIKLGEDDLYNEFIISTKFLRKIQTKSGSNKNVIYMEG